MGITTVRSPWNREGLTTPNDQRRTGVSPGSSSSRSDGGHVAGHVGKNAATNPRLRSDQGDNTLRATPTPGRLRELKNPY
jgi:hypothetical protein